ncbi:MAG: hypothetical protein HGB12_00175 [Bacteroidetes bacterium]|nr:hypothetical protein [Bacteroidota bacterium]
MENKILKKKYIVDNLYKYLTVKQQRLFDLYYLFNRDTLKAARMYIKETGGKEGRNGEIAIKSHYRNYPILRLAIEVNDCNISDLSEEEPIESPTLEWTLVETMKLYKHTEKEFFKYEEKVSEWKEEYGTIEQLIEMRDKYKKEMKELLKQITDFQNKFGEMLNDDSLKIGMLSDSDLMTELKKYTNEAQEYLAKEKWYNRNKIKEVA